MVEPRDDGDVGDFHIEDPDRIDKDHPGDRDPAAEGSLSPDATAGGPEVPDREGRTEAPGGLTGGQNAPRRDEDQNGGSAAASNAEEDVAGGPATGTGQNAELDEKDVPETSAEMPPGRKYGTPGITDGT